MRKAKWLIMFLIAFAVAAPASAVEVNLGGFPSYMSTVARYIEGATYRSASANESDDRIFFVDTTLRVTPQLVLSDAVTIRAQVDILDNNVWGGFTDQLLGGGSTIVNSGASPGDTFRGTILHGNATDDCLTFGNFCAVERDNGFFNIRMLHADIVLPNNLGFVRVGRQPFDWGLGILANGGWDPDSDRGFLVDRFLWLKTFGLGVDQSLTAVFVSDRITQGTGLNTGTGDGWDGGALALIYNYADMNGVNVTVGGYVFPYIHQDAFIGGFGDLDRYTLYSGLIDLKGSSWRLAGELQGGFGEIENILGAADSSLSNALLWVVRGEYSPSSIDYLTVVGAEFGWADGDKNDGSWIAGDDIEGGVIVFNPAYNLDNLLFKHVMPSIYQDAHGNILARADASVQNAYYARMYTTVPLTERLSFSPQVLVGWNNETDGLIRNPNATYEYDAVVSGTNADADGVAIVQPKPNASSYIGTEVEGTLTVGIYPGVKLDIIGSLLVAGSGVTDLLEAQAFARDNDGSNLDLGDFGNVTDQAALDAAIATELGTQIVGGQEADDIIWGVKTKLTILIDEFFKAEG